MFFSGGFPFGDDAFHGGHSRAKRDVDTVKFYKLLEIDKDASLAEIKKAYRRLAIKHHPDKGGDPEVFKEMSRAYEVLSDPEKRELYDRYGEEGLDGQASSDPTDIFDVFFGGGRRQPGGKKKGEDVVSTLKVQLDQIYNGATRKLAVNKDIICVDCKGLGGPPDAMQSCEDCHGRGVKIQRIQMGPMIQQTQSVCGSCRGQGKMLAPNKKCKKCSGGGTVKERKLLEVHIDKGVPHQHKIVFNGEADERPGEIPGDVVFVIDQQDHPTFKRKGADLYISKKISLVEALLGYSFTVTHLDGRKLLIKNTPNTVTRPQAVLGVSGEGMPRYKDPFRKGHLFIVFDIEFPADSHFSNPEISNKLSKLLPPPLVPLVPETPEMEVCHTEQIEASESRSQSREAYQEDDDEGEGQGGRHNVQCRQQ